jgi:hypothetical protein
MGKEIFRARQEPLSQGIPMEERVRMRKVEEPGADLLFVFQ